MKVQSQRNKQARFEGRQKTKNKKQKNKKTKNLGRIRLTYLL
jgi:hypothetical protein